MKMLWLIFLFQVSLQLQCNQQQITAHIGGEFILRCKYDANRFRLSKKYWCRGDSRQSCEILVDTDFNGKTKPRTQMTDAGKMGVFVKVTGLQWVDSGMYWVGIDKIYTDIMTSVKVVITEVPVSTPRLWPLSSLVNRPTCWGGAVTVRCDCEKGTAVHYTWYQHSQQGEVLLDGSPDLHLHCGTVVKDSSYYCLATNSVSKKSSEVLSVQLIRPADSNCIYVIKMQGQPIYDCPDRLSTTTTTTPLLSTCNQSLQWNQTYQDLLLSRGWMGKPSWYAVLRWGSFVSLLIFLWIVIECTKSKHRHIWKRKRKRKRKRRAHIEKMSHLTY